MEIASLPDAGRRVIAEPPPPIYPKPARPDPDTFFIPDPVGIAKAMSGAAPLNGHAAVVPPARAASTSRDRRSGADELVSFDPGPEFRYDWARLKVTRTRDAEHGEPDSSYSGFDPGPEVRYDWSRTEAARLERQNLRSKPFDPGRLGLETNPDRLAAPRVAAGAAVAMVLAVLAAAPISPFQINEPIPKPEISPFGLVATETGVGNDLPSAESTPEPPVATVTDPGLTPTGADRAADGVLRSRNRESPVPSPTPDTKISSPLQGSGTGRVAKAPLGDGPFFPIRGEFGYGEAMARFGAPRSGHIHAGQDVFAPAGTPLVAIYDSIVIDNSSGGGGGNTVTLYSQQAGKSYAYLHLNSPTPLAVGQKVRAGQPIGAVGCSGSCFGDHVHFEIRGGRDPYGPATDPLPELLTWPQAPRYDAP